MNAQSAMNRTMKMFMICQGSSISSMAHGQPACSTRELGLGEQLRLLKKCRLTDEEI